MDDRYINTGIYHQVAEANGVAVSEVNRIASFIGSQMAKLITEDDPKVSMKMDYLGNLYSKPKSREIIHKKHENNGRLTISKGRGADHQSTGIDDRGTSDNLET